MRNGVTWNLPEVLFKEFIFHQAHLLHFIGRLIGQPAKMKGPMKNHPVKLFLKRPF